MCFFFVFLGRGGYVNMWHTSFILLFLFCLFCGVCDCGINYDFLFQYCAIFSLLGAFRNYILLGGEILSLLCISLVMMNWGKIEHKRMIF